MPDTDITLIPGGNALLKDKFSTYEIQTVYDLMACMQGAITNSSMRRIIMLMLRGHYSSALNNPSDMSHLSCYTWRPDDAAGKSGTLVVDFTHVYSDSKPGDLPGIYVGFGGLTINKLAMGNHHSHSDDRSVENFASAGTLALRVHHITTSASDSYDLAEVSSLFLRAMARVFRETTGASSFEVRGYAEPAKNKLSNHATHYEVVLSLEISYTLSAALSEETHRIKTISGVIASHT